MGFTPDRHPPGRVFMHEVVEDALFWDAGVRVEDELLEINGILVSTMGSDQFVRMLSNLRPLEMTIARGGAEVDDDRIVYQVFVGHERHHLGFTPNRHPPGRVVVADVNPRAWIWAQGVRIGDEIAEINGKAVETMADHEFTRLLHEIRPLTVNFIRGTSAINGEAATPQRRGRAGVVGGVGHGGSLPPPRYSAELQVLANNAQILGHQALLAKYEYEKISEEANKAAPKAFDAMLDKFLETEVSWGDAVLNWKRAFGARHITDNMVAGAARLATVPDDLDARADFILSDLRHGLNMVGGEDDARSRTRHWAQSGDGDDGRCSDPRHRVQMQYAEVEDGPSPYARGPLRRGGCCERSAAYIWNERLRKEEQQRREGEWERAGLEDRSPSRAAPCAPECHRTPWSGPPNWVPAAPRGENRVATLQQRFDEQFRNTPSSKKRNDLEGIMEDLDHLEGIVIRHAAMDKQQVHMHDCRDTGEATFFRAEAFRNLAEATSMAARTVDGAGACGGCGSLRSPPRSPGRAEPFVSEVGQLREQVLLVQAKALRDREWRMRRDERPPLLFA